MVIQTQTIRPLLPKNFVRLFDHFAGLALKELMLFVSFLNNFYAGKEKAFIEKIEFLNSIED